MSDKVKNIDIKNRIYYFFIDITNIKNFHSSYIKLEESSYKNILIYYIGNVMIKDSKYIKINNGNPLENIFSKVNGHFKEINKNKYSALVPTNKSKEKIKKYEKIWRKIRF